MFIAKYPDGKVITEKDMFWDEVPGGMNQVELTLPIPVHYIDPITKEQKPAPNRTVSLNGCEKYYFFNEAVSSLAAGSKGGVKNKLVAKAIGGIIGDNVIEIRMDAGGFTTVRCFKIEQLAQSGIKLGA
jgi:hypothetical protein